MLSSPLNGGVGSKIGPKSLPHPVGREYRNDHTSTSAKFYWAYQNNTLHLYDSDFVGNIESIIVCGQSHISLLRSSRSDQCIDFSHLDVVQFLDCQFDLRFACTNVSDKHQCVVVFDFLHCTFSGERMFNDGELVHTSVRVWLIRGSFSSERGGGDVESFF